MTCARLARNGSIINIRKIKERICAMKQLTDRQLKMLDDAAKWHHIREDAKEAQFIMSILVIAVVVCGLLGYYHA
jgi:hypothetical protein